MPQRSPSLWVRRCRLPSRGRAGLRRRSHSRAAAVCPSAHTSDKLWSHPPGAGARIPQRLGGAFAYRRYRGLDRSSFEVDLPVEILREAEEQDRGFGDFCGSSRRRRPAAWLPAAAWPGRSLPGPAVRCCWSDRPVHRHFAHLPYATSPMTRHWRGRWRCAT